MCACLDFWLLRFLMETPMNQVELIFLLRVILVSADMPARGHACDHMIIDMAMKQPVTRHGKFVLTYFCRIFGHFQIVEHHSHIHRQLSHRLRDTL